ncbi:MAG: MBL fold metallo-hydrolase [Candidatus Woesearchaeota archaeon]
MISRISEGVWKFTGTDNVNAYLICAGDKGCGHEGGSKGAVVIDAGNRADRQEMKNLLGKAADPDDVKAVIFTHLHYDHIGNFDLFPNAEFYASETELEDFRDSPASTTLSEEMAEKLRRPIGGSLKPLPRNICGLEVISTPGHTRGSVCIWHPAKGILFTGDTMFANKRFGRTDLPTSAPEKLNESLITLLDYDFRILAPGHDY